MILKKTQDVFVRLVVLLSALTIIIGAIRNEQMKSSRCCVPLEQPIDLSMATIGLAIGAKQLRGRRRNIIYCRFSDEDLQTVESIENQRRRCFDFIKTNGFDPNDFELLTDDGVSGLLASRPRWSQILLMSPQKQLGILLVSEQSRIDRDDRAMPIIKNIVAYGGRFMTVSENIDTKKAAGKH